MLKLQIVKASEVSGGDLMCYVFSLEDLPKCHGSQRYFND